MTACCLERQARARYERDDSAAICGVRRFFLDRGFLPADISAYPVFSAFSRYSLLQEMSASIISSWSFAYHGLYKLIGGCLCAVYFHEAKPVYFTVHRPSGAPALARIIDVLYGLCREAALPFLQIRFVDEKYLADFEGIRGYRLETRRHPQDDEYVYRVKDLLELSGAANFYKRKRIRRCSALTGLSLRPLTRANAGECLAVQDAWCQGKDCVSCASFGGCEREALRNMVELFDERRHTGLLLYMGEERAGYVICERITEKLAFLYFGKAVMEGFFVFLIYHLFTEPHTRESLEGLEYLNLNEDMGSPGLRLFKSHLSVHELWPKYICTFTGDGPAGFPEISLPPAGPAR
ncbi:MAG: DUF2156 domain-containing protein [Treponema sp.]|jgi:hypothetical protein|nr:DUF2156 domain-containing protein [Treponema sp.]